MGPSYHTLKHEYLFLLKIAVRPDLSFSRTRRFPVERASVMSQGMEAYSGVVLNTWSESAAVMVCSNVCRGRR